MNAKKKQEPKNVGERNVVTTYYGHSGKHTLRTNRAKDPDLAVEHAFRHMHRGHYIGAFVAEVFNSDTGQLYAVIVHNVVGEIRTIFRNDPTSRLVVMDFDPEVVKLVNEAKDVALVEWAEQELAREQAVITAISTAVKEGLGNG
jgi:hypothetical protein